MREDSVAQDQIKAFVERILRMKEERKAIDADIREIYAEAKGSGFDKTVLGKLVNYVEKRAADANAVMESESLFDLYLSAYDSASGRVGALPSHAHTREAANWQAPRTASLGDQKDAYRAGNPISQDFQYENASVYFFAFPEIERIKIGVSNNVETRLRDLSDEQGCEGIILRVMPGNRQAEMVEHERFAAWQIEGEWFHDCPEVRALIATHTHEAKSEPQPSPKAGQAREDAASSIGDAGSQLVHSSVENEAAEISTPITEQQDASHPAGDLTTSPKLPQGQVAPIQPETATSFADAGAHGAEADDSDSNAVALVPATNDGSANIGGDHEVPAHSEPLIQYRRPGPHAPDVEQNGSEHQRAEHPATNEAPAGRVADESPAPLSFADKIKRLRPNCQHPEACRSSGGKAHCGPCGRAAETGSAA